MGRAVGGAIRVYGAPTLAAPSPLVQGPTHTVELKLYKPHPTTKLGVTLTSTGMEAPAVTALAPDGAAQASA